MKIIHIIARLVVLPFMLLFLGSCQQPATPSTSSKTITITKVGYTINSVSSDWWSATATTKPSLVYHFWIYYSGDISAADISSARVYLPGSTSSYWTIDPSLYFDATNHLVGGNGSYWLTANPKELPIGSLTAKVTLTNGNTASFPFTMGSPGSTLTNNYTYVFSAQDETAASYPLVSTQALERATPTSFTNSGSTISVSFTVNGPSTVAFNGFVWLYDANYNYVGVSPYFLDSSTGAISSTLGGTAFNNSSGQSNTVTLTLSNVTNNGTQVSATQFSGIAHCRVIVQDGVQYGGINGFSYSTYDYRAISAYYP